MRTVLITGIGGDLAQSVATILSTDRKELRLIGVDIHDQHAGSLYVNDFLLVPHAYDEHYMDAIGEIFARYEVDYAIPMTDQELRVILPTLSGQTKWITCGKDGISAGLDKLETNRKLVEFGLQVPWTFAADEGVPGEFPCILKGRHGSGSANVFLIRDRDEARILSANHPKSIFQELLLPADQEITCAVYRSSDGQIGVLQMLRRLGGGVTNWAKVIEVPEISRACRIVAEGLNLVGSLNVQLRLTEDGPRIFEINPRFSSTVLMRHKMGFTDVLWALNEAEGKSVQLVRVTPGIMAARTQGASLIQ